MKKLILNIFILSLFAISCKKDDPSPVPPTPVAYMSLTAGSTWNYELINNTAPATTTSYSLTSTSRDSTINGKTYHVFTNSTGANEYYNISASDYYVFRKLPAAFGSGSVENVYLKDNAAVGTGWSESYAVSTSGFPANVTVTNTVTEKGIVKVVNNITYNDVVKVTTTLAVTISGIPIPPSAIVTDIQSFYAPKFGLIQSFNKVDVDFSGITEHTDQQTNLKTADIK